MKAIFHDRYGGFDVLGLRDLPTPAPAAGEVLVRVQAAGLHVGDCFGVRGAPFAMRMVSGLMRPKVGVPGFDLAGTVEAVGAGVTRLRPGDEVFGASQGTCAEYVCAREDRLAPRPANLSPVQAAALATSGLAALHGIRDAARVQAGQSVLIVGASGGVGSYAVQIARALGAEVTGVCGPANVERVRSIGAAHVIDYTREDFTAGPRRWDVILDNIEDRPLSARRRALTPDGTLVCNSGTGATGMRMMLRLLAPLVLAPFVRHKLKRFISAPKYADLVVLQQMVESGAVTPLIDRTFPLAETPAALAYIEQGHARGKVVVTV